MTRALPLTGIPRPQVPQSRAVSRYDLGVKVAPNQRELTGAYDHYVGVIA